MSGKTLSNPGRIDRRSARTRRLLHQALMQLIVRKNYESITVQDLLDEADVGRSTFYAHYAGKDDLLRRGFEQLRSELHASGTDRVDNGEVVLAFSSVLFAHAERFKDIYRGLIGSSGSMIVLTEIRHALTDMVEPEIKPLEASGFPKSLAIRFVVDSFQTVLTWWLERQPELRCDEVDVRFRQLVLPVFTRAIP